MKLSFGYYASWVMAVIEIALSLAAAAAAYTHGGPPIRTTTTATRKWLPPSNRTSWTDDINADSNKSGKNQYAHYYHPSPPKMMSSRTALNHLQKPFSFLTNPPWWREPPATTSTIIATSLLPLATPTTTPVDSLLLGGCLVESCLSVALLSHIVPAPLVAATPNTTSTLAEQSDGATTAIRNKKQRRLIKTESEDIDGENDNVRTDMGCDETTIGDTASRKNRKKAIVASEAVNHTCKEEEPPAKCSASSSSSSSTTRPPTATAVALNDEDDDSSSAVTPSIVDPAHERARKALQAASSLISALSKNKNRTRARIPDEDEQETKLYAPPQGETVDENSVIAPERVAAGDRSDEASYPEPSNSRPPAVVGDNDEEMEESLNDVETSLGTTTTENSTSVDSATQREKIAETQNSISSSDFDDNDENTEAAVGATEALSTSGNDETLIASEIHMVDDIKRAGVGTTRGKNTTAFDPLSRSEDPMQQKMRKPSSPENVASNSAINAPPKSSTRPYVNVTEKEQLSIMGEPPRVESADVSAGPDSPRKQRPPKTTAAANKEHPESLLPSGDKNPRMKESIVDKSPPREKEAAASFSPNMTKSAAFTNLGAALIGRTDTLREGGRTNDSITLEGSDIRAGSSERGKANETGLLMTEDDTAALADSEDGESTGPFTGDKARIEPDEAGSVATPNSSVRKTKHVQATDPSPDLQHPSRPHNPLMAVSEEQTISTAPSAPIPFKTPVAPNVPEGAFGRSNDTDTEKESLSHADAEAEPSSPSPAPLNVSSFADPATEQARGTESPRQDKPKSDDSSTPSVPTRGTVLTEPTLLEGVVDGTAPSQTDEPVLDWSAPSNSVASTSSTSVSDEETASSFLSAPIPEEFLGGSGDMRLSHERPSALTQPTDDVGSHSSANTSQKRYSPLKSTIGPENVSLLAGDFMVPGEAKRLFANNTFGRADSTRSLAGTVASQTSSRKPERHSNPLKSSIGSDRSSLIGDGAYVPPTRRKVSPKREDPSKTVSRTKAMPERPRSVGSTVPSQDPARGLNPLKSTFGADRVSSFARAPYMAHAESSNAAAVGDSINRRKMKRVFTSGRSANETLGSVPSPPKSASSPVPPTLQPLKSESAHVGRPIQETSSSSVPAPASAPGMVPFEPLVPEGAFGGAKPSYTYHTSADSSVPPATQRVRRNSPLVSVSDEESLASSAPVPAPFMTPRSEPLVPEGAFGDSSTISPTIQPLKTEGQPVNRPNLDASSSVSSPASAPFMVPFQPIVPEGAFGGAKPSYTYQPAAEVTIPPSPATVRRKSSLMSVSDEELLESSAPVPAPFMVPRREPLVPEGAFGVSSPGAAGPSVPASASSQAQASAIPPTLQPLESEGSSVTRPNPDSSSPFQAAPASAPFMVPFAPIVPEGAFGGAKPSYTYQPAADMSIPPSPQPVRRNNPLMSVSDEEVLSAAPPAPDEFIISATKKRYGGSSDKVPARSLKQDGLDPSYRKLSDLAIPDQNVGQQHTRDPVVPENNDPNRAVESREEYSDPNEQAVPVEASSVSLNSSSRSVVPSATKVFAKPLVTEADLASAFERISRVSFESFESEETIAERHPRMDTSPTSAPVSYETTRSDSQSIDKEPFSASESIPLDPFVANSSDAPVEALETSMDSSEEDIGAGFDVVDETNPIAFETAGVDPAQLRDSVVAHEPAATHGTDEAVAPLGSGEEYLQLYPGHGTDPVDSLQSVAFREWDGPLGAETAEGHVGEAQTAREGFFDLEDEDGSYKDFGIDEGPQGGRQYADHEAMAPSFPPTSEPTVSSIPFHTSEPTVSSIPFRSSQEPPRFASRPEMNREFKASFKRISATSRRTRPPVIWASESVDAVQHSKLHRDRRATVSSAMHPEPSISSILSSLPRDPPPDNAIRTITSTHLAAAFRELSQEPRGQLDRNVRDEKSQISAFQVEPQGSLEEHVSIPDTAHSRVNTFEKLPHEPLQSSAHEDDVPVPGMGEINDSFRDESRESTFTEMQHEWTETTADKDKTSVREIGQMESLESAFSPVDNVAHESLERTASVENDADLAPEPLSPFLYDIGPYAAIARGRDPNKISPYAPNNSSLKSIEPVVSNHLDGEPGKERAPERHSDRTDDAQTASSSASSFPSVFPDLRRERPSRFSSYAPNKASWKSIAPKPMPELTPEPNASGRAAPRFSSYAPNKASWKSVAPKKLPEPQPSSPVTVDRTRKPSYAPDKASWKASALELNKRVLLGGGKPVEKLTDPESPRATSSPPRATPQTINRASPPAPPPQQHAPIPLSPYSSLASPRPASPTLAPDFERFRQKSPSYLESLSGGKNARKHKPWMYRPNRPFGNPYIANLNGESCSERNDIDRLQEPGKNENR